MIKKEYLKIILILIIIIIAVLVTVYVGNQEFRQFIDINILKKEIAQNTSNSIFFSTTETPTVIPADAYVYSIQSGKFKVYDKESKEIGLQKVAVGNPIYVKIDKYVALSDRESTTIHLLENGKVKWERKVDMPIISVNVNKNGYVSVISKHNIYKSVINVFTKDGDRLFRTYISDTYAIDLDISSDNKYLAVGTINYNKPLPETVVKIISIDKSKKEPDNAILQEYYIPKLLVKIKYKETGELNAQFTDSIYYLATEEKKAEEIYKLDGKQEFVDIKNSQNIAIIEKENVNIFSSKYYLKIINPYGKQISIISFENSMPKNMKCNENLIAINMGTETFIYTDNGCLKKRFKAKNEILDFEISKYILTIIYLDKFEIIEI